MPSKGFRLSPPGSGADPAIFVPYTGATTDLDLGNHAFKTTSNFDLYSDSNSKIRLGSNLNGEIYSDGNAVIVDPNFGSNILSIGSLSSGNNVYRLKFNTTTNQGIISFTGTTKTFSFANDDGNIVASPNFRFKNSGSYTTTLTLGTQAANINYTLPTTSANGLLRNTSGAWSWDTTAYYKSGDSPSFGLVSDSRLISYHRFQYSGRDYSLNARDITGGTYTGGYLNGVLAANSLAGTYDDYATITMTLRAKLTDGNQSGANIFKLSKTSYKWQLTLNDSDLSIADDKIHLLIVSNGTTILNWKSTGTYNDKAWHEIAVRASASGTSFFIDGVADAGTYVTGTSSTAAGFDLMATATAVSIGQSSKTSIADLAIYSSTLSDTEIVKIQDLMNYVPFFKGLTVSNIGANLAPSADAFIKATGLLYYVAGVPTGQVLISYSDTSTWNGNVDLINQGIIDLSATIGDTGSAVNPSLYRGAVNSNSSGNSAFYGKNTSGDPYNVTAFKGYAESGGGTEYAFEAEKGDFTAIDNYGLIMGTGRDAKVYYDGTDVILNTALVGTGVLKFASSGNWSTTAPTATTTKYLIVKDSAGTLYKIKADSVA